MRLLSGDEFESLFTSFRASAFRLETRERYHLAKDEEEPVRQFLAGEPVDMEWFQPWLSLMRQHNEQGKTVRRVRIVSSPTSDYTRFGLMTAAYNIPAGDHIRYLERSEAERLELPESDWWMFDDERLALLRFTPDDILLGAEIISDPVTIKQHVKWRDLAWDRSVSREEFMNVSA